MGLLLTVLSAAQTTEVELWFLSVSGLALWIALSWRGVPEQAAGSSDTHQGVLSLCLFVLMVVHAQFSLAH